eukprot:GHRR01034993.1.p1 GENE.GHRR01034993.1~~GHRR01034993.1.p1  ORF type:complete len:106 (+),score=21.36 GHRR01034993.1:240-557(+)
MQTVYCLPLNSLNNLLDKPDACIHACKHVQNHVTALRGQKRSCASAAKTSHHWCDGSAQRVLVCVTLWRNLGGGRNLTSREGVCDAEVRRHKLVQWCLHHHLLER